MTSKGKKQGRPPLAEGHTVFGNYLIKRGVTHEQAAAELEISRVYVSSLARGLKYPSAELMYSIEEWSEGKVRMQSWFED